MSEPKPGEWWWVRLYDGHVVPAQRTDRYVAEDRWVLFEDMARVVLSEEHSTTPLERIPTPEEVSCDE